MGSSRTTPAQTPEANSVSPIKATTPGLPLAITLTPTDTFGGRIFEGGFNPDILKQNSSVEKIWEKVMLKRKMRGTLEAI